MQFPHTYFEDEVREGFYVPCMMKCSWAASMEVLYEIARVCERHQIRWFAYSGTLLGAVRHGGFIPWDDDLDICMFRDDYIRFNEVAPKELPEGYRVVNAQNEEEFYELLTQVRSSDYIKFDEDYLHKHHKFPFVSGVDIFPLDSLIRDPEAEKLRESLAELANILAVSFCKDHPSYRERTKEELEDIMRYLEKQCNFTFDRSRSLKKQVYTLMDRLYAMGDAKEADKVVHMTYWLKQKSHAFPIEYFGHTVMLPFETIQIPVPVDYDGVLRIQYGEYMSSVRDGGMHDYPWYKAEEKLLYDEKGVKLTRRYEFSKKDLEKGISPKQKTLTMRIRELLELLKEAQTEIGQAIEKQDISAALELLGNCQDVAVGIGNAIEESLGEGFATVGILEEYCEQVYKVYEKLAGADDFGADNGITADSGMGDVSWKDQSVGSLDTILHQIEESVQNDVRERKEVLFLPYKASLWDGLWSVWKAAKEDPDCDVYVIPIPWYEKNPNRSLGEMHYEGSLFPKNVTVTDYNSYDFESRRPAAVFIQSPYDEDNYVTSVHPFFYAKNLKQYTDELIYIPPFVTDEIEVTDGRSVFNMSYYVTVPGVVHADKIMVQSEKMRERYIEVLTEFAGEETREIWEGKVLGHGLPKADVDQTVAKEQGLQIPREWEKYMTGQDGNRKKVILMFTSVATLMRNGEQTLTKLEDVFRIFQENAERVTLLWQIDPNCRMVVKEAKPELYKEYQKLTEQYRKADFGIYDDSGDQYRAVTLCDAYYGDRSRMAQLCLREKKPVMLQDVNVV